MKTMKKALAILLVSILTFVLLIPAHALDGTISVTSVTSARAGDTVTVTVSLQNNPGLLTAFFNISYDDTVLELQSVTDAGLFGTDGMMTGGDISAVPLGVVFMEENANPVSADGDLMTLTFKVADNAPQGSYSVSVTCDPQNTFDGTAAMQPYDLVTASGTVSTVRIPADADGDGVVSMKDAVMITRWLAHWQGVTIDQASADVNGDSQVTLIDVILIKRYLVGGWNVTLQ